MIALVNYLGLIFYKGKYMSTIKPSADNANNLHDLLVEGNSFNIENIDFSKPPFNWKPDENDPIYKTNDPLTNEDLTTRKFKGEGTFDALMESVHNHIMEEYRSGRITGDDYVKAYIALTEASMSNAVQFLTVRDQAYWSSIAAQMQAKISVVQLEAQKYALIAQKYEALLAEAKFANTKMDTLNKESTYKSTEYSLDKLLPAQYTLVLEQTESQRAQTLDTRLDGSTVKGSIGKQKDLYSKQIEAYQNDAEYKVGKFYTDAFTVMKTTDEGLTPPTNFTNKNIDEVLTSIRKNVGLE